jgi:hypothetical protein
MATLFRGGYRTGAFIELAPYGSHDPDFVFDPDRQDAAWDEPGREFIAAMEHDDAPFAAMAARGMAAQPAPIGA